MSNSKFRTVINKKANINLCKESLEVLEDMCMRLSCTKSQIVRYLILHYGKSLK